MRFEVVATLYIRIMVLRDMTQLSSVDVHHSFEGACFFPRTVRKEAAQSLPSKLPQFPGTASCDNTECGNLCTAGGVLHQGAH